jgi:hypothetical protein
MYPRRLDGFNVTAADPLADVVRRDRGRVTFTERPKDQRQTLPRCDRCTGREVHPARLVRIRPLREVAPHGSASARSPAARRPGQARLRRRSGRVRGGGGRAAGAARGAFAAAGAEPTIADFAAAEFAASHAASRSDSVGGFDGSSACQASPASRSGARITVRIGRRSARRVGVVAVSVQDPRISSGELAARSGSQTGQFSTHRLRRRVGWT